MKLHDLFYLSVLAIVVPPTLADDSSRNEAAIAEVAAGKSTEALASWWGFRAEDATSALQSAIDSRASRVVVDKQTTPWIVDEIRLRGNQEVFFEPGVEVLAKQGSFQATSASLFTANDCENLRLIGPGATLRMRRDDYAKPPYKKGEWRHVLNLLGCKDVLVQGLTLAESGGDGIYVARGHSRKQSVNVTVRNVVCDRNYRQGVSVISAENLLIEDCVLRNTAGTAPAAGIDFEPNLADERLVNCILRNCRIEDNRGVGIAIYAVPLDGTSADMSIRCEGCVTRGTNDRSSIIYTANGGTNGPVKGSIEFTDCRFEDRGHAGIVIGSKPVNGASLVFRNCLIADSGDSPKSPAPVVFTAGSADETQVGGVELANLKVRMRGNEPVIRFDDQAGVSLAGLSGKIVLERDASHETIELNASTLDRLIPSNALTRIPSVSPQSLAWPELPAWPDKKAVPPHRLRVRAVYWLWGRPGEEVHCDLRYQPVGAATGEPMKISVCTRENQKLVEAQVPLEQTLEFKFTPREHGVHQIVCEPRNHTVQMTACDRPFLVSGSGPVIHFIHTPIDVFFAAPRGTQQLALRMQGEGEAERVGVAVFDPTGRELWTRPNLSQAEHQIYQPQNASNDSVWRCKFSLPQTGVLEDHYLELRGVPPLISFSADWLSSRAGQ